MSIRDPRGGSDRGRGRGRGRGRNKTMMWEWETYRPAPSVYDNIWHIRQAPVAVTPNLPNDCPLPDARTRILERRQTEDGFGRNYYYVEITYLDGQEPTSTWVQSSDNGERGGTEIERVDASRILQYVTPRELERFENEQFKIEADAQAVADREEKEEQIRKRMAKNARMTEIGKGALNPTLGGLGIDPELRSSSKPRGRPRGRGRGRGGGRGSWRTRGATAPAGMRSNEIAHDDIVDSDASQPSLQRAATSDREVPETSESEDDLLGPTSPALKRSAFVTNSALPLSPVHQQIPAALASSRRVNSVLDNDHGDITSEDDIGSTSSAAMQLQFEGGEGNMASIDADSDDQDELDRHRAKRPRTESITPQHTLMFPPSSQIEVSESEGSSVLAGHFSAVNADQCSDASLDDHAALHNGFSSSPKAKLSRDGALDNSEDRSDEEDAEEYVVETISEHYLDDNGKIFYLVKWQGYDDSYDWLPGEDLDGAAELVHEYRESVKRKKGKAKRN
ncbi:hypothetical protein E8E13_007993 [Curvularia kusanoi]|uniref:Chromo domain-containing protein n=1 Tax=Curvularia kusanoi TaxID=90978 RepID=A0A9P4WCX8_CURKU|nr:hypothetical protein E8E13_007993 [Curvularia kusanoi]